MQADQGRDIFKGLTTLCDVFAQGKGFIVAAETLENCCPLAIECFVVERESLRVIEVGQSIVKTVEGGARSRACDQSP